MTKEKNPAITLCRVFSMFLVIICHIVVYYTFIPGHSFLKEVFNVGVYSFLAISGYLYGDKHIDNFRTWFKNRAIKILLPSCIVSLCYFIGVFASGSSYDLFSIIVYLLNLQGFTFLLPNHIGFTENNILAPLWFVTVIMLCYCLVPLLQKIKSNPFKIPQKQMIFLGILCISIAYLSSAFLQLFLFHFITFVLGYLCGSNQIAAKIKTPIFISATTVAFLLQIVRLLLLSTIGDTTFYYPYVGISHMSLGIWILFLFFFAKQKAPLYTKKMASFRIIRFLDETSFFIYLTHGLFTTGALSPYHWNCSLFIATFLFFLFSFSSALLLKLICRLITRE